jgi:hypothetical protein
LAARTVEVRVSEAAQERKYREAHGLCGALAIGRSWHTGRWRTGVKRIKATHSPIARAARFRQRRGMTDTPPDRLCIDPSSPHFDVEVLRRGVGIKFRSIQRHDVEEYCMSEGWVRVQAGKTVDRRGKPLLLKLTGPVEAWYEDANAGADTATDTESAPEA